MTPDSSGTMDFLSQISSLLIVTCAAGIIWVVLMAFVMSRARERKRRAQQGLPPLPGAHTVAYQKMKTWLNPPPQSAPPFSPPTAAPASPPPAPDLSLLMGDLPPAQPPLGEMFPEPVPDEASYASATPSRQEHAIPMIDSVPIEESMSVPSVDEPQDAVELLRVWRDLADGGLIMEIGGRRFRSVRELRSADLERRFQSVVRDLVALAQVQPTREESKPPATTAPGRATIQPAPETEAPPSLSPGSMFRQMTRAAMGQAPTPREEKPLLSIADQIEDLLQARLVDLPEFRQRVIHVRPSMQGGVRIEVDGEFYDGVGDVQDPAVRDLLMDVVREWESKQ